MERGVDMDSGDASEEADAASEAEVANGPAVAAPAPAPPISAPATPSDSVRAAWLARKRAHTADSVHSLLARLGLLEYLDKFGELGFDDVPYMLSMSDAQIHEMFEDVGLRTGHRMKLEDAIVAGRSTLIGTSL